MQYTRKFQKVPSKQKFHQIEYFHFTIFLSLNILKIFWQVIMWLFLTWASDSCVPTTFCCCCCSPTADFGLFFQCWVAYNLRLLRVAKLALNRQFGRPIVICLILDFVKIWRKIQKEDRVGLKRVVVIMPNFLFVAPRWWRQGQFWNIN